MATNVINPKDILHKEAFKRTLPSLILDEAGRGRVSGDAGTEAIAGYDPLRYEIFSQADFLREWDVNSHLINSLKYYPNQYFKDSTASDGNNQKYFRKVKTRVAIAWQRQIYTKRLSTLTGNNIALSIANAITGKSKKDTLGLFREGWVVKGIENAIFQCIGANLKVGDGAICFYKEGGRIGWRCFSYEKGDTLYPMYNPMTGKLKAFGRKYYGTTAENGEVRTVEYLDVWDTSYYYRYVWDDKPTGDASPDWKRIYAATHGFETVPVAYARYGEPCWANSQSLIEAHEMAMSQLAENNAAYALRILVTMGANMELISSLDGTPMQINADDVNAKASFLEPADASGSFDVQLKAYEKAIYRSSFAVETPELKSGSDLSSLTVKMLFADAYQKALEDAQFFQPFLNDVVEIFKSGYGAEIGKTAEFNTLKVIAEIQPYIFMSESEVINALVQLVGSKVISHRSASGIAYELLGYGDIDEAELVAQEEHDALVGQTATLTNVVNQARNAK